MFGVITLWVGAWVIWDLVARSGDRSALRRVDHVSQTTGQIGFALLLIGIAAGFVTAIVGGFNLAAPWLLIAYALVLSDLLSCAGRPFTRRVSGLLRTIQPQTSRASPAAPERMQRSSFSSASGC